MNGSKSMARMLRNEVAREVGTVAVVAAGASMDRGTGLIPQLVLAKA